MLSTFWVLILLFDFIKDEASFILQNTVFSKLEKSKLSGAKWLKMSSHHFVTVCVVCVLCAAHTPCSAHMDMSSPITKSSWSWPDPMGSVPTWREERSGGSPDSTGGPEPKYAEVTDSVRRSKEPKRATSKKYSHSYLESKASKLSAKTQEKITESLPNLEIHERLGQPLEDVEKRGDSKFSDGNSMKKWRNRRNVEIDEKYFMKKLFNTYGDGTSLSIEGFEKLIKRLGLFRMIENLENFDHSNVLENRGSVPKDGEKHSQEIGLVDANSSNSPQKCLNSGELLNTVSQNSSSVRANKTSASDVKELPGWLFSRVCPILIYHLASNTRSEREGCIVPMNAYSPTMTGPIVDVFAVKNVEEIDEETRNMVQVWTYSTISIVFISISGLLGMFVVPFMGKKYYHQVLQFFVALAIGTLCGDALIHLLPHAMMSHHSHNHETALSGKSEAEMEAEHNINMWKGLTAMIGLIIFFFTEKALSMIAEWRKHRQRKSKLPSRVRVMRETDGNNSNNVGEKLCKHKYSSYPYCYGEITTETRDNHHDHVHNDHERPATIEEEKPLTSKCNSVCKMKENNDDTKIKNNLSGEEWHMEGENGQLKNLGKALNNSVGIGNPETRDEVCLNESESYTVIIREHENNHHGHTHSHGHVHAAPDSMSSVVWMVVMGDGLHNFTDGMAIGAAFAANIAGGFSTAIAVFCHELPHELGDFAVLLKAGMSWQQALFYNLLSSVLCLFGMVIGVLLGATPAATSWIFAAAAGMFIYIALVDMIPELSSSHSEEGGSHWECVLQALGLLTGLGVMLIIALYEHDLKNLFSD
ncbi:zinc transporter foi isoform X2 [Venturia canescens]|uniref:zinc transporter foi isoform X2 n=1 Tax=Venturia canescens TaxID=32260 RepID=UPI001C9D262A|nr:zinc transporter foi-like isoform X2 [Venturia canescens]